MGNKRFIRLNNIAPELRDGFGLDTLVLEQEMVSTNGGIDLSRIDSGKISSDEYYRLFVPYFFGGSNSPDNKKILELANKYSAIISPCSMSLDSIEELSEHMSVGYQVAHFHYILGKKHNLRRSFPRMCCGMSSRSVMLSLIKSGYPNAAYAYSNRHDHGYVILPFVFEKENIQGTIVIDPTFDQLWDDDRKRNAVFIKLGLKWEYKTDWKNGGDLFPDRVCSIDILRKTSGNTAGIYYFHREGEKYLKKAFSNQIIIRGS